MDNNNPNTGIPGSDTNQGQAPVANIPVQQPEQPVQPVGEQPQVPSGQPAVPQPESVNPGQENPGSTVGA